MTRVLVTDAGRGSGMSIVRALGRRGIEVLAADASRRSPAFVSRFTTERVLYPNPRTHPSETVETLARVARDRRVDLVIPVGEDLVVLLSEARERFDGAVLALADPAAIAVARDKLATVELAARVGVPTPRTVLVETASEAVREADRFDWPIVLKPQASRAARGGRRLDAFSVAYAADAGGLERRMRAFEGRCAVLLQEYCGGEGHGMGLLMDRGEPLMAFQHRRLREVPFTGGPSSFRESVALDPSLLDASVRLLRALDWTGPAMVEFKVGAQGAKLMEINGRLWGSLALAVKSGVDVPGGIVDLYLFPQVTQRPPQLTYTIGKRSRDLTLELNWITSVLFGGRSYAFLEVPRRSEALAAAARLLDPRDGFDVLSLSDPLPGVAEFAEMAVRATRRLRRRSSGAPARAAG